MDMCAENSKRGETAIIPNDSQLSTGYWKWYINNYNAGAGEMAQNSGAQTALMLGMFDS